MRYKAAVIGLGQIGSAFDDDAKRVDIWTHSGAYSACPRTELVAGADPEPRRRNAFLARRKTARAHADWREMLRAEKPDIVSVCTPVATHREIALGAAEAGVKAIFLEKPMCAEVRQAREVLEACERLGVVLAVNHSRRWDPVVTQARDLVASGAIGEPRSLVGWYSEKIYNMGTHLLDAMRLLGGELDWVSGDRFADASGDEPTVAGFLGFSSGAKGFLACQGRRESFVFELDVLGSRGRLRLTDNCRRLELSQFKESPNFSGYDELASFPVPAKADRPSGFLAAVGDLADCLDGLKKAPSCTGRDGLLALAAAEALRVSAADGGRRIFLEEFAAAGRKPA
ncbi:MAG: Gfo/Idh/MocA family oxidoreductase [Elusimicrobia bacterium]|nr:Gfo/Idh/MocA family oxidoreductase [Elusimicrobiota bacterium]